MEITITISDKTAELIQHKAEENGKDLAEFVGEFVEENFTNENGEKRERKHNLLQFAGKFSSGKTDTSERMHEILYSEDFNPAEGFSVK
jgi:predicted Ser/Thr protein kinase